jgi:hypothetical protein
MRGTDFTFRRRHNVDSFPWLVVAALIATTGCGDGKLKRYPVHGSVTVDGKPADSAMVIFCPVNPVPELEKLRPSGKADSTGTFTLMTFDEGDGAPAGDYKVLVKWPAPAQVDAREGRGGAPGPDRLRGKYYNLDNTPLTAKVEAQSNELPPFDLKSK